MHIQDIFAEHETTFSFEFFPPKTAEASEALFEDIRSIEGYNLAFVSVTYGAGGSTRELTHNLVARIHNQTTLDPIPHLTCVCHAESDITRILDRYNAAGISNILALGGDPPRDLKDYDRKADAFQNANDLVRFIREFNASGKHHDDRGFGIGVAGFPEGHPATPNRVLEMDYLKAKVDAGADYICTQLFFDNHDFLDFRDRCDIAGVSVPILAGIMPITSTAGMARLAELAAGARYPAKLQRALAACHDDADAVLRAGIHYATRQCAELLDEGVRGIHLYTLNRLTVTCEIYAGLGLHDPNST